MQRCASRGIFYAVKNFWLIFPECKLFGLLLASLLRGGLDKWKICEIYDLDTKLLPFSWLLSEGLCVGWYKNQIKFSETLIFSTSYLATYWKDHIKLSRRGCILSLSFGYLLRGMRAVSPALWAIGNVIKKPFGGNEWVNKASSDRHDTAKNGKQNTLF